MFRKLACERLPFEMVALGCLRLYATFAGLVLLAGENLQAAPTKDPVAQAISAVFDGDDTHQPGDLITRDQFDRVVEHLKSTKAPVDRFAPLREQIPPGDAYIQRLNASGRGKAFLRKVSGTPGGFRNVEELASRPGGEKTLNQLSRSKGGERMIEYLATAPGGKKTMKQIPGGKSQGQPASRIYTAQQLQIAMQTVAAAP